MYKNKLLYIIVYLTLSSGNRSYIVYLNFQGLFINSHPLKTKNFYYNIQYSYVQHKTFISLAGHITSIKFFVHFYNFYSISTQDILITEEESGSSQDLK